MKRPAKVMARVVMVTAAAAVATATGCGGAEEGSQESPGTVGYVTFADVQEILDARCASCHYGNQLMLGGENVREELLTETTTCFVDGEVVERPVVTPGDPANSTLWHKTANIDLNCGREMPPTGEGGLIEIAPEEFAIIEAWILAGAPE